LEFWLVLRALPLGDLKPMRINYREQGPMMRTLVAKTSLVRIAQSACVLLAFCMVIGPGFSEALGFQDVEIARLLVPEGQNASAQANVPSPKPADEGYLIGPSDILAISVWKDAELTRTIPVRPDGKISLPLVGELEVSGLTASAVQNILIRKLKEYISDPQVTVIVQEVKSRTYSILGKVAKPGSYPLGKPTTVLEAIAIAGGFLDFAKQSKIYIMRPVSGGSTQTLPFDYKKVIKGRNPEQNVELQNGDTIIVP
jgi:polysaccharide export outer membrane protein